MGILKLNLKRLRKTDILWMNDHFCRHRHTYLEHQNCFVEENPTDAPTYERIGFLDIETSGLNANWDYIISYAIKELDGSITGRVLEKKEILNWKILDKRLLEDFCRDIISFDRIIVYWGKDRRHDLPFLRTRALRWNIDFPKYQDLKITDVYDIVKNKLRLHRNRLENIANFLDIPSKLHRLDEKWWQKAKVGYKPALKYVWLHNCEDVETLEEVWERINLYTRQSNTSI